MGEVEEWNMVVRCVIVPRSEHIRSFISKAENYYGSIIAGNSHDYYKLDFKDVESWKRINQLQKSYDPWNLFFFTGSVPML